MCCFTLISPTVLENMSVEIRLARKRAKDAEDSSQTDNIVTPGDVITSDTGFMR